MWCSFHGCCLCFVLLSLCWGGCPQVANTRSLEKSMENKKLISIVVPVFNEETNIEPLYTALGPIIEQLEARYDFELLFTDNHSTDRTFDVLRSLALKDPRIRVLRFSR